MLFQKKVIAAIIFLCSVFFIGLTPASAAFVDITISELIYQDLAGFELDVNYDSTALTLDYYTLTDELGSFSAGDAEEWSLGDDGIGTFNLSVLSYLMDFSTQSDDFILATLSFSGDDSAISNIILSNIILSDPYGEAIPFSVNGTDINVVPEPGTMCLMGFGVALLGFACRRRTAK